MDDEEKLGIVAMVDILGVKKFSISEMKELYIHQKKLIDDCKLIKKK